MFFVTGKVYWILKIYYNIFMSYDFTTVKLFPTLPEVNLEFLAQGQIFVCLLAQNSHMMLIASQLTF